MLTERIIYSSSLPWTFNVASASGSHILDPQGRKILDFTSGWNVVNLGWNPPALIETAIAQLRRNAYASVWTGDAARTSFAEALTEALPGPLKAIGRATGGTEANEEAIKTARAYTRRYDILGLWPTYHGQSLATLAVGSAPATMTDLGQLAAGVIQLRFPAGSGDESEGELLESFLRQVDEALRTETVAAVITEAGLVSGTGSTLVAPSGYLKALREATTRYGTLLVLDEVGTGFSRCGRLFAMEREGVVPDIVTLGKAITNGISPMGAMVTTREIAEATGELTELTSTFGWTPVGCATALECLRIHQRDRVWELAEAKGRRLVRALRSGLGGNAVATVRGVGMELGIRFNDGVRSVTGTSVADSVVARALADGLHVVGDRDRNIQLMPPLTIEDEAMDRGVEILLRAIQAVVVH